jgi:hypothetical protein
MAVHCFFPDQETLTRVDGHAFTKKTFAAGFLHPHQPVMLMGLQSDWPASKCCDAISEVLASDMLKITCWILESVRPTMHHCAGTAWQASSLRERFGDKHFDITAPSGRVSMTMSDYLDFSERQCDEDPLYLFDA